jgi:hypothetical protein
MNIDINGSGGRDSIIFNGDGGDSTEKIKITTLDQFVEEQGISKIDFIKADIEGAERDMLKGAQKVLKRFAPKLAICTYHLRDDPFILGKIITDANPDYRIVFLKKKLYAAIQ